MEQHSNRNPFCILNLENFHHQKYLNVLLKIFPDKSEQLQHIVGISSHFFYTFYAFLAVRCVHV